MNLQIILESINELKEKVDQKRFKKMNFPLLERIIKRLDSFSNDCNECRKYLNDFECVIEEIKAESYNAENRYLSLMKDATSHLQTSHKLVPEGHYTSMYMTYGITFGMAAGIIYSQLIDEMTYMAIGLPIGVGIGLSIGAGLDAKAKKAGLLI